MTMKYAIFFVLLLAASALACSSSTTLGPEGGTLLAGTHAAFPSTGTTPSESPEVFITPKGRRIVPGMVDELGWVLPLDIRRPRPEFDRPARQTPAEITHRRSLLGPPTFPETRLGPDDGHTQNETSIDVSGQTLVAGWNNFTDSTLVMGAGRSTDGGDTWGFELFSGHDLMSDPVVVAAGGGRWYFAYIASGGSGGTDVDVYIRRSDDDGATWQAPVVVTLNTTFDDKPFIAARGDEVLVAWADFGFSPAKVRSARSLDGALTFGNNTILAINSAAGNAAIPIIAPDGTYYVFWRGSSQEFLWMSKSIDQGDTWSMDSSIAAMSPLPSTLPGGFRALNAPIATVDPVTGDLLVLWNDQLFGNPDILATSSTDGGDTWSTPVQVNDDASGQAQFYPWVVIDESRIAHAIWYDRRQNGSDIDVYYATSSDLGATWSDNVRITAQAFTPVLPHDGGAAFIGDYNAIAAEGGKAYPFFQDAREGNQDVYVVTISTEEAIFTDGFESGDTASWSSTVAPP
ncbi:MAG: glycoside hydrolase [Deltaproteobacteria bacterium]|nr:glycoside hydrolase [Deltaproteobacteria bacterium]